MTNDAWPQLKHRLAQSDEQALAALHGRHWGQLLVLAERLLRNKSLAEEVVEDVFLAVWQHRHRMEAVDNIDAYLYKAVKNQSLNKLAAEAKTRLQQGLEAVEHTALEGGNNPLSQLLQAEEWMQLHQAVAQLPPRCQTIFRLVRDQGLSYKQVAAALSISTNTVNAQMAIAVKRLVQALRPADTTGNNH